MPAYFLELGFPEFISFEYRARTGRHFGKIMLAALSTRIETKDPLHAGDHYRIDLGGGLGLECVIIGVQPSLYEDPGYVTMEPRLGIAPRQISEILDIVDRLIALGWE